MKSESCWTKGACEARALLGCDRVRRARRRYQQCTEFIKSYVEKRMEPQPGLNLEQTLEAVLLKTLSNIREDAAKQCLRELDYHNNSPLIMAICGSKGSNLNISQMVALVGQQAVSNKRIPNGFVHRTLPHFTKHSKARNCLLGMVRPAHVRLLRRTPTPRASLRTRSTAA
jgi:DNA-directed RNA polymerase III subunit RPC1